MPADITSQADYTVWVGDLNSRLEIERDKVIDAMDSARNMVQQVYSRDFKTRKSFKFEEEKESSEINLKGKSEAQRREDDMMRNQVLVEKFLELDELKRIIANGEKSFMKLKVFIIVIKKYHHEFHIELHTQLLPSAASWRAKSDSCPRTSSTLVLMIMILQPKTELLVTLYVGHRRKIFQTRMLKFLKCSNDFQ